MRKEKTIEKIKMLIDISMDQFRDLRKLVDMLEKTENEDMGRKLEEMHSLFYRQAVHGDDEKSYLESILQSIERETGGSELEAINQLLKEIFIFKMLLKSNLIVEKK